jgi:signal transduction histidine kinase
VIRASQVAHRLCGENAIFREFDTLFPLQVASEKSGRKPFSISVALRGEALQGVEARFERKDGAVFNLLLNAGVLSNAQGKKVGCVVTLTDITDQKRAEEGLKQITIEAQETSRFKTRFVSNVSHELRTPLNAIIGYTNLLLQGIYGNLEPKQMAPLKGVLRNGNDLLNLVNDLLDLSRIEAGKLSINLEPLDVHVQMKEIVAGMQPLLNEKPLEIQWKVEDTLPIIYTDAGKVKQIFINLLTNAMKFTPKGKIIIALRDLPEKDGIEIAIQDTGIGIQAEELKKIFEVFHQVDSDLTRKFGGAGLGLSIVKEFVDFLQGQIHVESHYGRGSTFTVFLPRLIASETIQKKLSYRK